MLKQNLVVVPYGNASLRSNWITDASARDFDVVLLFYHDEIEDRQLLAPDQAFALHHLKDFKWVMIQNLLARVSPALLEQYEYFFFIDDDVAIETPMINTLFQWARDYDLKLTQPVLTRDSYKSWRALRAKRLSGIRFVSAVELMCPMMHRLAVQELLPTFALNRSGWGLDILWGELIRARYGERSIAVFDSITARHTKPVGRGELYEKLGEPAAAERDEIFSRFHIGNTRIRTLPLPENGIISRFLSYRALQRKLAR